MTGKDLIVYILENDLANEEVFKDGIFVGFVPAEELATKFNVGVHTVIWWSNLGLLESMQIGEKLYFRRDVLDPRRQTEKLYSRRDVLDPRRQTEKEKCCGEEYYCCKQ